MDFGSLLHVAQKNERNSKKEPARCYRSTFDPPKKEARDSKALSANIQKFLQRKEEEEKKREVEAMQRKAELLALRSQDGKAKKRVAAMLKRTKAANKSVIDDAVDNDNTAVTLGGPAQPDEDDYGYVSQEASAFYAKLMDKYQSAPSEEPAFPQRAPKAAVKDLISTKDRVRNALLRAEEEEMMPHKRKRKSKDKEGKEDDDGDHTINYTSSDKRDLGSGERESSQKREDSQKREESQRRPENKPRKPVPAPMDFSQLLKLAEQKQFEPITKTEVKSKSQDEEEVGGRPMTKKQKLEYERELEARRRRQERDIARQKALNEKMRGPQGRPKAHALNMDEEKNAKNLPHTISQNNKDDSGSDSSSGRVTKFDGKDSERSALRIPRVSESERRDDRPRIPKVSESERREERPRVKKKPENERDERPKIPKLLESERRDERSRMLKATTGERGDERPGKSIVTGTERRDERPRMFKLSDGERRNCKPMIHKLFESEQRNEKAKIPKLPDTDWKDEKRRVMISENERREERLNGGYRKNDRTVDRVEAKSGHSPHYVTQTVAGDKRASLAKMTGQNVGYRHEEEHQNIKRESSQKYNNSVVSQQKLSQLSGNESHLVVNSFSKSAGIKGVVEKSIEPYKSSFSQHNISAKSGAVEERPKNNSSMVKNPGAPSFGNRHHGTIKSRLQTKKSAAPYVDKPKQIDNHHKDLDDLFGDSDLPVIRSNVPKMLKVPINIPNNSGTKNSEQNTVNKHKPSVSPVENMSKMQLKNSGVAQQLDGLRERKLVAAVREIQSVQLSGNSSSDATNESTKIKPEKPSGQGIPSDRSRKLPPPQMRVKQFPPPDVRGPKQFTPTDVRGRKQFPPPDVQRQKQFPPPDVRSRKQFPPTDVRKKPKPVPVKRRIEDSDDDEYDSELDDFIDDGPEDEEDYSKHIKEIFGYDKSRYMDMDEDDECMEANFAQVLKEEFVSTKIGILEDLEDIKKEQEEKRRKALFKKRKSR